MNQKVGKSIRKIVQIGDGSGIILPKKYLLKQELDRGDEVELFFDDIVKIKPVNARDILQELGEVSEEERVSDLSESG